MHAAGMFFLITFLKAGSRPRGVNVRSLPDCTHRLTNFSRVSMPSVQAQLTETQTKQASNEHRQERGQTFCQNATLVSFSIRDRDKAHWYENPRDEP